MKALLFALLLGLCPLAQASPLSEAIHAESRPGADKARDIYRHPQQTLTFFDVQPDMTVVEVWPGASGWYTAILAPLLRQQGTLYAAQFPADSDIPFYRRSLKQFREKLQARPALYDQVRISALYPPAHTRIAPAGSADRVLTFRNVHNWAKAGNTDAVFASFYRALKPGGILGVVEHRAPPGRSLQWQIDNGYMTEAYVIDAARRAGFELLAKSDINANPKDDTDHPAGVWTLPPTLRLKDQNRDHYLAIGESDRMTLKFIKPD
ncbi:hypothetical protein A11A3_09867 [Alcanivorax hongdengensis A-11-3]|uniref:Methyltransferase n=1 Tax=Alcanivorax hongdengensis A-11-3 TaxID=1177179 RepID=L0WAW9_9GAMM|nr:class I SAM-dependent methyltransferase [Alcanivorax hongdengensis]EKF74116.1 hypothetical protein A11A3_09867 [Alcanivorax hongdengensis A-11-3]